MQAGTLTLGVVERSVGLADQIAANANNAVHSFREGAIDRRLSGSPRKWWTTVRMRSMLA
jgi:hypothetical protein